MSLVQSFEKSGNKLFRLRGYIPVVLFVLAIPAIYVSKINFLDSRNGCFPLVSLFGVFMSCLGLFIRFYTVGTTLGRTSGRNTKEQIAETLNTKGMYSIVRHPLYLGNYFMWMGIVIHTFNFEYFIISSLLFWIYYERIMFAEERFLEKQFGENFLIWSNQVPAFFPKIKQFVSAEAPFSVVTVIRREYPGISALIIGFWFVDFMRVVLFCEFKTAPIFTYFIPVFVFAFLFSGIVSFLKKKTKILEEKNRW